MHRLTLATAVAFCLLASTGCNTANSRYQKVSATMTPDPKTQKNIKRGVIEPGYTPEMVYLALGKPTIPADGIVDATRDGEWIYRDYQSAGTDRDFVRAGFRRRVVFDPVRRGDVVVTEPIDTKAFPNLEPRSLHVTFHDGRVVEIKRVADM